MIISRRLVEGCRITKMLVLLLLLLQLKIVQITASPPVSKEQIIHEKVLTNYNVDVRPMGPKGFTNVLFDLEVYQIDYLDIKKQELSVKALTSLIWEDKRLAWTETEYDNVTKIVISNDKVWTPDIVLHSDTLSERYNVHNDIYKSKVQINSQGVVVWVAQVVWSPSCQVDITWFPIDQQSCQLTFGSFAYDTNQMKIDFGNRPTGVDGFLPPENENTVESGEWDVKNLSTTIGKRKFQCCDEEFSVITYTIVMNRYSEFYFLYIFLPIISQFFLFLLVFRIPPESGERLGFGITILLNITMYIIFISEKLPEKSNNRVMIGLIFVSMFSILSFGLGISAITMCLSRKRTPLPKWLEILTFGKCKPPARQNNLKLSPLKQNATPDVVDTPISAITSELRGYPTIANHGWVTAMEIVDGRMFYLFTAFVIGVPIIICLSLNKEFLGTLQ